MLLIVIVESGLDTCQNIVWLKTYDIVQKSTEFVHLRLYLDNGAGIFLDEINMAGYLLLEVIRLEIELMDLVLLLENIKVLLVLVESHQILDSHLDIVLKVSQLIEGLISKILRWWSVILNTLKVRNNLFGIDLLFINDILQHVKLLVNLLGYFILETFLVENALLHILTLLQIFGALLVDILEHLNMLVRCLLEGQRLSPLSLIFEEALIAESGIMRGRVDL